MPFIFIISEVKISILNPCLLNAGNKYSCKVMLALSSLEDSTIYNCYDYCIVAPHSPCTQQTQGGEAGKASLLLALIAGWATSLHLPPPPLRNKVQKNTVNGKITELQTPSRPPSPHFHSPDTSKVAK